MKKMLLLCLLTSFGYAGWHRYKVTHQWDALPHAEQPKAEPSHAEQPPVAATTPVPTPATSAPAPVPVASATPTRHVAPVGTLTKDQLLSAIKKDARVYSLESLLGAPIFTKPTGWSTLYCWKDKLDIGGDSPVGIAVEVVNYKGDPIAVGIYDAESKSITPLPWHDKVARAYNEAMQWYYNDQANQAAIATQNRQLELYKHAAADAQRWERSQKPQFGSSLSLPARAVGSRSDDQQALTAASAPTETRAGYVTTPPPFNPYTATLSFHATDGLSDGWQGPMRSNVGDAQADAAEHNIWVRENNKHTSPLPEAEAHPVFQ